MRGRHFIIFLEIWGDFRHLFGGEGLIKIIILRKLFGKKIIGSSLYMFIVIVIVN